MLIGLLALAAVPAKAGASNPYPLNLAAWIAIDDYPAEALTAHQEGVVGVRLGVSDGGRVESCAVVTSSGSPALDATTCALAFTRARFEPARDPGGKAVAGEFGTRIAWRYPTNVGPAVGPAPVTPPIELGGTAIQEASGSSILHVDANGVIDRCDQSERPYANVLRPPDICTLFPVGARFSPPTVRHGKPVRRKVDVALRVVSTVVR